ncbi:MAG: hypothetical protein JXN62_13325 [Bacteroidales bacterium]|nr:hypothetical protein [Bacteroidales bacterium]
MANFRVKFKKDYINAYTREKVAYKGQVIDVETTGGKPKEWDVIQALKRLNGVNSLGVASSITMWEII